MESLHSFHIPVMGTGFTIDSPIKVAPYGISSVISLVDDSLIENMRKYYCNVHAEDYVPVEDGDADARARRITLYLNLVDRIVEQEFKDIQAASFETDKRLSRYFELLDERSPTRQLYQQMLVENDDAQKHQMQEALRQQMRPGSIDVNIMTKLDRVNYKDGEKLDREFSDAISALRGFAQSTLSASIVFSAGVNPRLYTAVADYEDFFADLDGNSKKQIIVKVSDYRSALTQGRIFAKKGLWVSEYRIESSVNCGGHAFPTGGHLFGPILEEFASKRTELIDSLFTIYKKAVAKQQEGEIATPLPVKFTAQGGVGTANEHQLLMRHFGMDAVGWGTPFLLVPEVTCVDEESLEKLIAAGVGDLYMSNSSPLGVPFHNLRNSASEETRLHRIARGKPGSPCLNGNLALNTEFGEEPLCIASRAYQKRKLEELRNQDLPPDELARKEHEVTEKSCICFDLGAGAMLKRSIPYKAALLHPSICPGPNLAYYSKACSLEQLIGHIYGRNDVLDPTIERPHFFIKELTIYLDYFKKQLSNVRHNLNDQISDSLNTFYSNLLSGMDFYGALAENLDEDMIEKKSLFLADLKQLKEELEDSLQLCPAAFASSSNSTASSAPIAH